MVRVGLPNSVDFLSNLKKVNLNKKCSRHSSDLAE